MQAPKPVDMQKLLRRVLRLVNAGYLSKGFAQFSASPVVDAQKPKVKQVLRSKHPQSAEGVEELTEEDIADAPGVAPHWTSEASFHEIFARPPMARAMAVEALSYEELGGLYHGGESYRSTLLGLVRQINAGLLHEGSAAFLGDLHLIGLEKPGAKVDVRPIGVPDPRAGAA